LSEPHHTYWSLYSDFTGTAINLSLTLLNAAIDLISFAGILFSIYPPLFAALLAYSIGGTGLSLWLGRVGPWVMTSRRRIENDMYDQIVEECR
jgi:ABC-type uncharacterized transport system fused permease/ATPase subunit